MESGPRALGNRSILADPRRRGHEGHPERPDQAPRAVPAVRARRSSRRRPATTSTRTTLRPSCCMVYPVRPEKRDEIPAVDPRRRHRPAADGATRRRIRATTTLIEAFEAATGVPVLLNTSLQRERADLLHARGGHRHLPPNEDGRARHGRSSRGEARDMTTASTLGRPMRILVVNQYFHPDRSATSQLLTELCEDLVEHHEVTVVTGRPSYDPVGRPLLRGLVAEDRHGDVHVAPRPGRRRSTADGDGRAPDELRDVPAVERRRRDEGRPAGRRARDDRSPVRSPRRPRRASACGASRSCT